LAEALQRDAAFVLAEDEGQLGVATPDRFFAPYFVEDGVGTWTELNLSIVEVAASIVGEACLGMIAYDAAATDDAGLSELADAYDDSSDFRVVVWPTDLDEHRAAGDDLARYAEFVRRLAASDRQPVAAYGGFFAVLLQFKGLAGFSHGLGYGDKRDLEPVLGGGLPPARYYLPGLRDGVSPADLPLLVRGMNESDVLSLVCDCAICSGLLEQGGVPRFLAELTDTEEHVNARRRVVSVATPKVYKLTRYHFLQARAHEVAWVSETESWADVESIVRAGSEWVADRLGSRAVAHIERWLVAARPSKEDPEAT
jgi:hypothetical protein